MKAVPIREDGWVRFAAPVAPLVPTIALQRNATMAGNAKYALLPGPRMELRVEWPAGEDDQNRIHHLLAVFGKQLPAATELALGVAELQRQCEESAWPCVLRSSGRLTVALETAPPVHATVSPVGGGVRVFAGMVDFGAAAPVCHQAAAVLLLEAGLLVRMARPVSAEAHGFEVVFSELPSASELAEAFACLSTACALTANELLALLDETVARTFLSFRGWAADEQTQQHQEE